MGETVKQLYESNLEEMVIEIETERLRDFHDHPFKIKEDRQIKSRHLKTIKVDGWTRILKDDFYAWYAKQDRHQIIERKGEIRKKQPEEGADMVPVK